MSMNSSNDQGQILHLSAWIDKQYLDPQFKKKAADTFSSNKPYPHIVLDGFLNESKARQILSEIKSAPMRKVVNEGFRSSSEIDLSHCHAVAEYQKFASSLEMLSFVESIAHMQIRSLETVFAFRYDKGDFFKCHHDENGKRKITFILFLSDSTQEDGGCFDLYGSENGVPTSVVAKVVPKFNRLVFYVGDKIGFHGVDPILSDNPRYNIICGYN